MAYGARNRDLAITKEHPAATVRHKVKILNKAVNTLKIKDRVFGSRQVAENTRWFDPVTAGSDLYRCLPDYLQPGLKVVFVGFNPGERSARIGHYYAGRGNQFWNFLHESGLVPEKLRPEDDHRILEFRLGLTDVVKRWSRSCGSLRAIDYQKGIPPLIAKLHEVRPRAVAFNGKGAYQKVSGRFVRLGLQRENLEGAHVFVLPSTSGRNGSLTRAAKLAHFRRLARWVKENG
jgi:TDG/mug DNA glycosylase family protein